VSSVFVSIIQAEARSLTLHARRTRWELVEDEIRVLVHADEISRSKLIVRHKTDNGQENSLTRSVSTDCLQNLG
jgi:hypothetical protein